MKKLVTPAKISGSCQTDHTFKNTSNLEKWVSLAKTSHTCKNWLHVIKWVTLRKMDHTCKNWSHLKKMDHIWRSHLDVSHLQNASLFQKWVTLAKIGQTLLHLEKRVTLPETGQSYWNGSHLKNASHFQICVTIKRMGHSCKAKWHKRKCVTFEINVSFSKKRCHSQKWVKLP